MHATATHTRSVALLATGDEIQNGDILNSNAKDIAKRLFDEGISLGMQMVTGDQIEEIETAIRFLLSTHSALIIMGGLGPTSDDRTRFALGHALNQELIFNEDTWNDIMARLTKLGYKNPPKTNRQQAFFPENAIILPNPHGTAAGCMLHENHQFIFMLPGPPFECLPMVDNFVLPELKKQHYAKTFYQKKWFMFSVSEGEIAEKLDACVAPYDCRTGYRICYPYVEFKIYTQNLEGFNTVVPLIQQILEPYILLDGSQMASEILKNSLKTPLSILDCATGGLLEYTLKTPENSSYLQFSAQNPDIIIHGLQEFWNGKTPTETQETGLEMTFKKNKNLNIHQKIPYRGLRVKQYAVEYISREIIRYLNL